MGQRTGALVGAIGGLLFVVLNAGLLPAPLPVVVRAAGVVAFVAVVAYAVVRAPRSPDAATRPPRSAMRTYWICVAAEIVAIGVGSLVLARLVHRPELSPLWVVFVVGVHFLPFASAFRVPLFRVLALTLMVVAVTGGVAALGAGTVAVGWAAVAAGFVLLAFAYAGAVQQRRRSAV